ncbi:hypothetical protein BKA93DRAFT_747556 [Sparassis latifolia]
MTSGLWIFDILHPLLLSSYPPLLLPSSPPPVFHTSSPEKMLLDKGDWYSASQKDMPGNVNEPPASNARASFFVLNIRRVAAPPPPPGHSPVPPPSSNVAHAWSRARPHAREPSPTPLPDPSTFLGDRTNTWPGTGMCQAMDLRPPLQTRGLHFSSSTFDTQPLQHLPQSFPPPSAVERACSLSRGCARERKWGPRCKCGGFVLCPQRLTHGYSTTFSRLFPGASTTLGRGTCMQPGTSS